MASFKLEAADARGLETDMETSAGISRDVTVLEAHRPVHHATCLDHSLVGGALVGRRGCLQAQRRGLRLEQLGKLGISDHRIKNNTEEYALTEPLAGYIYSPPRRPHC